MSKNERKKANLSEELYRVVYAVLFLCIVLAAAGGLIGIAELGVRHFLLGIVALGLIVLWRLLSLKGRLLYGICFLAAVIALFIFVKPANIWGFFSGYFGWLTGPNAYYIDQQPAYELFQTVLVALICYFMEVLLERFQKIRYVLAGILIVALLICMFLRKSISHMGTVFIIWYGLLSYIEWTKCHWPKEKSGERKLYMLWILPFCILYLLILSLLPAFEKPYDWKIVKKAYETVRESVITVVEDITNGNAEEFDIDFAGASETGEIKGNILDTKQQIMIVQGSKRLKTNVYLVGKIYDSFDGHAWSARENTLQNERLMDTLETLYALERYDGIRANFADETKLAVRYRFFQSGYLFAPLKTQKIDCEKAYTQDREFEFQKKQGYGTDYELSFTQLNLDQPALYEYMEEQKPENEELWNTVVARTIPASEHRPTLAELQAYRQEIAMHNQTDVVLSEKAADYLEQITKNETTEIGKLQAIEKELSSYTYTRIPGAVPSKIKSSGEFLDYFLEKKEGYCSYFATAFVLLARAEGIPARYVEGFSIATHADKAVSVYSGNSHAWPEVYIAGFGWVPFEPTPGYAEIRYTPWDIGGTAYAGTAGKPYGYGGHEEQEEQEDKKQDDNESEYDIQRTVIFLKIVGITLGMIFVMATICFVLERMIFSFRYRRMNTEERYMIEIKRNLVLLQKFHIERGLAETFSELKARAQGVLPEAALDFLHDYEAYVYGEAPVTEECLQKAKEQQLLLQQSLKERRKQRFSLHVIYDIVRAKIKAHR